MDSIDKKIDARRTEIAAEYITAGTLNRLVGMMKAMHGPDAIDRFVGGELELVDPYQRVREQEGVVYKKFVSARLDGKSWLDRFRARKVHLGESVPSILLSEEFRPAKAVTIYEVAFILLKRVFSFKESTTENICAYAQKHGFTEPNPEVACLILQMIKSEELKTDSSDDFIITMHKPIKNNKGEPCVLWIHPFGVNDCRFGLHGYPVPNSKSFREIGIYAVAYIASQTTYTDWVLAP